MQVKLLEIQAELKDEVLYLPCFCQWRAAQDPCLPSLVLTERDILPTQGEVYLAPRE